MPHSGCHVLRFWCILVPKCLILGSLGAQSCPKWCPRSSKWCPKGIQKAVALSLFGCPRTHLLRKLLSERSWAPFWLILGAPWHQNRGFSLDFSIHVDEVLDINSGHRFASSGVNAPNLHSKWILPLALYPGAQLIPNGTKHHWATWYQAETL